MASPTLSASCPPCSDTPLAITTSVISILTFLYALTVGLIYYYGLAKSSPEEMEQFIEKLSGSFREVEAMGQALEGVWAEDETTKTNQTEIILVLNQLREQIYSLESFQQRFEEHVSPSSWYARWFKRLDRMYYLIMREELQKRVAEKYRLIADLRHIRKRAEKIKDNRVENALWKEHYEMLKLILVERAEDAKLQTIYRKEQENMQAEQLQMLESSLRRVIRLEACGRTTTQGETSSPDPPPESTS